jgi:long-chain acyl-CoA synthetase
VDFKHSATCRNDAPISTNLEDHEAGVFYTSGSTGSIKGISHGHSKLMADVTEKVRRFALCGDDRILLCEPLCGNPLPLVFAVLPAALSGAQLTWLPTDSSSIGTTHEATIERAIRALVQDRITYLVTSPFTLRALVKRLESAEQISSQLTLRCCIIGGDVIPDDTYNRFRAIFGFSVCEMYGLTEALSCAIASGDEAAPKGKYMPFGDMQFRIIDESWMALPVGSVGEIAVHSALVMRGYVNDPETTALVLQDGWLKTGDLGYLDRDGSLRFVGRRKHVICYDGENIGPQEVESALLDHPRILEACVVGIPSQRNGEVPAAYVVTSSVDPPIAYEEIAAFLIERLASHKIPVAIRFMDVLPRNVNRKIDRKLLIARAREDFADAIAVESECD